MKQKINYLIIALVLIIEVLCLTTHVSYARIPTEKVEISIGEATAIAEHGNKILGVIKIIVVFIGVGGCMILGIRYMMASLEEKAQIKQAAILYLIGAILAFGITQIADVAYKMLN